MPPTPPSPVKSSPARRLQPASSTKGFRPIRIVLSNGIRKATWIHLLPLFAHSGQFRPVGPATTTSSSTFVKPGYNPTRHLHTPHTPDMLSRSAQALRVGTRQVAASTSRLPTTTAATATALQKSRAYATEVAVVRSTDAAQDFGPPAPPAQTEATIKRFTGPGFPRIPVSWCGAGRSASSEAVPPPASLPLPSSSTNTPRASATS